MELIPQKENFKKYRSNTRVSTSNNFSVTLDEEKMITGRIYYKVIKSGKYHYKFLFSNISDSTYDTGRVSRANLPAGEYEVISAYAGDSADTDNSKVLTDNLKPITFDSCIGKHVSSGEVFWSDEAELDIKENHYLVFEWTIRGKHFAFTPDKIAPSFVKWHDCDFFPDCTFPQPQLVGCDAEFEKNILFLGDSITMGLGTSVDGYNFWAARIAKALGDNYSMWNIGLGFARAQDAASDGIWLEKARQYDTAVVCLGVNDILQGRTADEIKHDLTVTVDLLKAAGIAVCLFTVPAFNWVGEHRKIWDDVNRYITDVLIHHTDYWFDMATASANPDNRYGSRDPIDGHPTDAVCEYIAQEFLKKYNTL